MYAFFEIWPARWEGFLCVHACVYILSILPAAAGKKKWATYCMHFSFLYIRFRYAFLSTGGKTAARPRLVHASAARGIIYKYAALYIHF